MKILDYNNIFSDVMILLFEPVLVHEQSAGSTVSAISGDTDEDGVFTVTVTPMDTGTLTLLVRAGSILLDAEGTALDTTNEIINDKTISVEKNRTYQSWVAEVMHYDLESGFKKDPDNDGIVNGAEQFFGTDPKVKSLEISNVEIINNLFCFTHPQTSDPAADVNATYFWSTDLVNFYESGFTNRYGQCMQINVEQNTPKSNMTTIKAAPSGTQVEQLFIKLEVTLEE